MSKTNIIKLVISVLFVITAFFLFAFEPPVNPTAFQSLHTIIAFVCLGIGVATALTTFHPGKK